MSKTLTYGQKIVFGYAVISFIALLIGAISVYALRSVVAEKDRVIAVNAQNLIDAAKLEAEANRRVADNRGYLLSRDPEFLQDLRLARKPFDALTSAMQEHLTTPEEKQALARIAQGSLAQIEAADRVMERRRTDRSLTEIVQQFQGEVVPRNREVSAAIAGFVELEERQMQQALQQSNAAAAMMGDLVLAIGGIGVAVAVCLALFLSRSLKRQIGSAVQHIQSSSNELQAAATQQTTGSKEQAASTNEIATTIRELVATARQIAESAQRVAGIAGQTAAGARSGDETVQKAGDAVADIKRQVDLIVNHMLDLGAKSQQIGGILEIINEMAEQTNILSINASIEAVGAGESGRRFGVVADEIRKLADRVAGSTKEIKSLIDEIRSAVHTTVMATESGSKAVDAGNREFKEVSATFQKIVELVETATEASREIELSTKQQTTAVEQVNIAIANVAQAAKESEVSCTQTLQTVSELTSLSKDLSRLIQPQLSA
jgi:methyl-accepting chemotaxis protein